MLLAYWAEHHSSLRPSASTASAHETKRVSAATYAETKAALGNDDRKMADLSLTLGCYGAVSTLLNMFEVPVPTGEPLPFPAQ